MAPTGGCCKGNLQKFLEYRRSGSNRHGAHAPPDFESGKRYCRVLLGITEFAYLSGFLFSSLLAVAGCCVLSGVSVVSNGGGFAVIVGIRAASIAGAVALVAASREEEFAAGGVLAEAGHFVLDHKQVELEVDSAR